MKTHACQTKNTWLFFVLNIIFSPIFATEVKLEIIDNGQGKTNETTAYAGIPFVLKVSVIDGNRDTGSVELQGLGQAHVIENTRSTNISIINGQMSYQNSYIYRVQTDKEGALNLGPAKVKQNNQTIESNILALNIVKPPADMQATQKQSDSETEDEEDKPATNQKHEIACRLTIDKKTAVVGEPITAKITILSHGPILQIAMEPPKFSGFSIKEIKQFSRKQETINNKAFNVLEKIYILTPQQQGQKEIAPIKVVYTTPIAHKQNRRFPFDDVFFSNFFEREHIEQKEITSNAVNVSITQLPAGQNSVDGVGSFTSFKAKLDKKEALINEAITLTLEINGKGNFDQIIAPKLNVPSFVKYYESKSTISEDLSTEYKGGKKHFEYIIQIGQEGTIEIPTQTFTYFDTETKTYRTLTSSPLDIKINPAPEQISQTNTTSSPAEAQHEETQEKEIKIQSKQDIHFIQEDGSASKKNSQPLSLFILIFFLFLVPTILYIHILLNFLSQKLGFLGKTTKKDHQKQLLKLHKEFNNLAKTNQAGKLYQFFLKFLAIKFDIKPEAVTHDLLQENFSRIEWQNEKITTFLDYLNECASIHFTNQEKNLVVKNHAHLFEKGSYWILLLTN